MVFLLDHAQLLSNWGDSTLNLAVLSLQTFGAFDQENRETSEAIRLVDDL